MDKAQIEFKQITYQDTKETLLTKHYAHRMPSISYAYGLFVGNILHGVCTFGQPASRSLQKGFFGNDYADCVIELNRLFIDDEVSQSVKNITSEFVGYCLRQLKQYNLLVVSFADSGMNHLGGIYQATNFDYLGKTPARTDKFGGFGKHSRHYDKQAVEFIRPFRTSKYKYIYWAGDKRWKKKMKALLKYEILPYPKDLDDKHYQVGDKKPQLYKDVINGDVISEEKAKHVLKDSNMDD